MFALDDLTVAKVRQLQQLVSNRLDTAELVQMINHGAGFNYVQAMTGLGYTNLTASELVRMRDHGVTASYVRRVKELFKESPSAEQLIRMRSDGEIGLR